MTDKEAVAILMWLLKASHPVVRAAAAFGLNEFRTHAEIDAKLKQLAADDPDKFVRRIAGEY